LGNQRSSRVSRRSYALQFPNIVVRLARESTCVYVTIVMPTAQPLVLGRRKFRSFATNEMDDQQ
jgi:hypothetical protein